jgi:hypothetical protein
MEGSSLTWCFFMLAVAALSPGFLHWKDDPKARTLPREVRPISRRYNRCEAALLSILKNLIGALGLMLGAAAVALVAHNGYASDGMPLDRTTTALLYSIIALTGLAGPALAYRLYRSTSMKPLGVLLGLISAAALVTNVTNLTRAEPGRAVSAAVTQFVSTPARVSVSASNTYGIDLQRLTAERAALYFNPTTEAAVAQARSAYMEADGAHRAECSERRNPKCGELSADLAAKQDTFLAAARDRTATERAETLDAEIASIHARLGTAADPAPAEQSGTSVPRDEPLPSREKATWQQIFVALATQIAIACSLVPWNLPRKPSKAAAIRQAIGDIPARPTKREPANEGDLAKFVHECISPARGESVELRALYLRFLDWCDEQRLSALPPRAFAQAVVRRCAEEQIEVRHHGSDVVCLDVKVAPAHLLH